MKMKAKPQVTVIPAAASSDAVAHFSKKMSFEADCWDVNYDMRNGVAEFVLVDVRSPELYEKCHALGAVNIPHSTMTEERMAEYPKDTLFIVYCTGPGCNGADKGALRLSKLGRPVKIMIGGMVTWEDVERNPVVRNGQ